MIAILSGSPHTELNSIARDGWQIVIFHEDVGVDLVNGPTIFPRRTHTGGQVGRISHILTWFVNNLHLIDNDILAELNPTFDFLSLTLLIYDLQRKSRKVGQLWWFLASWFCLLIAFSFESTTWVSESWWRSYFRRCLDQWSFVLE